MANKIVRIRLSDKEVVKDQSSEDRLIVYKDVSMLAKPSPYSRAPSKQDESEYTAYLAKEFDSSEEEYFYIVTEGPAEEAALLKLIYAEVQDYAEALRIWKMRSRYNIDRNVNVRAIQGSLRNIFTWIPGERILLPEFGSRLKYLLYEGITDANIEQIMAEIRHSISEWEPRVQVEKVIDASTVNDKENNTVKLEIVYCIPGLTDEQYTYSFEYTRPS